MPRSLLPHIALAASIVAALALPAAAHAQSSPWYLGSSLGLSHETNVYRLIDAATLPADLARADTVLTTTVLAGLDQRIGRQRLFGSAALRDHRYARNHALNNNGHGLSLGLDWTSIEQLSGRLSLQANSDLLLFNDKDVPTLLRKNSAHSEQLDASLRLGGAARWQAEAALGWRQQGHSAVEYRSREFHQTTASLGLRWRPGAALALGATVRAADGRYPHYLRLASGEDLADRFRSHDLDFTADWTPSGASVFSARLGSTNMRFSQASQRDFKGLTGELRWNWRPTAKLATSLTLLRDNGQDASRGISTVITGVDISRSSNLLRVKTDYALSAKFSLQLGATYVQRNLADVTTTVFGTRELIQGGDHSTHVGLGLRWTPTRNASLSCDFSRDRRAADGRLSSPYGAAVLGCVGQFTIQ